jgi:hypothetical protein
MRGGRCDAHIWHEEVDRVHTGVQVLAAARIEEKAYVACWGNFVRPRMKTP